MRLYVYFRTAFYCGFLAVERINIETKVSRKFHRRVLFLVFRFITGRRVRKFYFESNNTVEQSLEDATPSLG